MIPAPLPPSAESFKAHDSVWVEYDSVWLRPRLVFDQLNRTAFDACAEICNAILRMRLEGSSPRRLPTVCCELRTDGPGCYLLSFEIPDDERTAPRADGASATTSRLRKIGKRQDRAPDTRGPDAGLQLELHSATRILEEMLLAVDTICSTPSGHLGASARSSSHGSYVEFVNGVRVLRHIHLESWVALAQPRIQSILRRVFAPFLDPELHTMIVRGIPPQGSLGAGWVITASGALREFASGAPLEIPALHRSMLEAQKLTMPEQP